MARQINSEFKGTIGNLIFYERSGEYLIRTVQQQTTATRLAAKEFGRASSTAKRLRRLLAPLIPAPRNRQMQNRLTVAMRGFLAETEEQPIIGSDNNRLAGFGFDAGSAISECLLFPLNISAQADRKISVEIPAITPLEAIRAPEGTTKVEIRAMAAAFHPDDHSGFAGVPAVLEVPYSSAQQPPAVIELECITEPGSVAVVALSVSYFNGSRKITMPGFMPVEIIAAWRNNE